MWPEEFPPLPAALGSFTAAAHEKGRRRSSICPFLSLPSFWELVPWNGLAKPWDVEGEMGKNEWVTFSYIFWRLKTLFSRKNVNWRGNSSSTGSWGHFENKTQLQICRCGSFYWRSRIKWQKSPSQKESTQGAQAPTLVRSHQDLCNYSTKAPASDLHLQPANQKESDSLRKMRRR